MKKLGLALVVAVAGLTTACTTVAPTQHYRAYGQAEPLRIGGSFDPAMGGTVSITVNESEVIKQKLPFFTNSTELTGNYQGRHITVQVTRVKTFVSSYVRADVVVGSEKAATLTF